MTSIGQRKIDHLDLCAREDVGFRGKTTLLECVRLVHDALPELHTDDVTTQITVLGKTLSAPIVIAAMTGGTDEAGRVNRELASIAEERGFGFGLGSQRAMHRRPEAGESYRVRDVAKSALLLGNLGLVQARDMSTKAILELIDEVRADALCLHLNPAMELVQPGGDRDFRGGLETLARLARELPVPVVAKETGCGLSAAVGMRLRAAGIRHADVSGSGGTSWVGVETKRAAAEGKEDARLLGEAFWDWGIPTAASVGQLAPLGFETLIATGGIASGLDVAKALALGASCAGLARPVLKALTSGGREGALRFLDGVCAELRAVMLLTGCRTPHALVRAPKIVVGELERWLAPSETSR